MASKDVRISINLTGYRHSTGLSYDPVVNILIKRNDKELKNNNNARIETEKEKKEKERKVADLLAKKQEEKEEAEKVAIEAAEAKREKEAEKEQIALQKEHLRIEEEKRRIEEEKRRIEEEKRRIEEEGLSKKEKEERAAKEAERFRLKFRLKRSAENGDQFELVDAINSAKQANMPELQPDIEDAEKVLNMIEAGEKLKDAMSRRHLADVESAVNNIKKKKLEKEYALELIDADKLMNKLRRLERLRKEILELNQSTISEIRSYQKPPEAVHQVMIAVYLLLGYEECRLTRWKDMQVLIGQMGKESLKRQIAALEISNIDIDVAEFAEEMFLSKSDLITIREVSEGAATFYVWATSMIEEARNLTKEERKAAPSDSTGKGNFLGKTSSNRRISKSSQSNISTITNIKRKSSRISRAGQAT